MIWLIAISIMIILVTNCKKYKPRASSQYLIDNRCDFYKSHLPIEYHKHIVKNNKNVLDNLLTNFKTD